MKPSFLVGLTAAVVAAVSVAVLAVLVEAESSSLTVFTQQELLAYDGVQVPSNPLYLVVLGEVFDVTSGAEHYRPQPGSKPGGYAIFLGKDSSRAFHDGKFDQSVADVTDLSLAGVLDVAGWRDFYRSHNSYTKVGLLEGLYYDANGKPTQTLEKVEQLIQTGNEAKKYEDELTKTFVGCDSQYAGGRSSVWCTSPLHVPRIMRWTNRLTGSADSQRCACFSSVLLANLPPTASAEVYPDCAPDAQKCSFAK